MLTEILVHKMYLNSGTNLERKTSLKSQTRLEDLVRVSIAAVVFGAGTFCLGRFAFSNRGCVDGFFEENGICKDCSVHVDKNCIECSNSDTCEKCEGGYFADEKTCSSCEGRFGQDCQECTAGGCVKCNDSFFVSYGQCIDCRFIQGCKSG